MKLYTRYEGWLVVRCIKCIFCLLLPPHCLTQCGKSETWHLVHVTDLLSLFYSLLFYFLVMMHVD